MWSCSVLSRFVLSRSVSDRFVLTCSVLSRLVLFAPFWQQGHAFYNDTCSTLNMEEVLRSAN